MPQKARPRLRCGRFTEPTEARVRAPHYAAESSPPPSLWATYLEAHRGAGACASLRCRKLARAFVVGDLLRSPQRRGCVRLMTPQKARPRPRCGRLTLNTT